MKLILAAIIWIYIVLWVGSFLAFYPGIPAVLAVAGAVALGGRYAAGRRRRTMTSVETESIRVNEPARNAPAWSVLPDSTPGVALATTRRDRSIRT